MAIFIPTTCPICSADTHSTVPQRKDGELKGRIKTKCPKCFERVTLIQPQHKGGAFKGPAKGQCLNCMDEQEYDLTIPANRKVTLEPVIPKAETLT